MRVRVLLFAQLREQAGKSLLEMDLPSQSTLRDARAAIAQLLPSSQILLRKCALAVNDSYAPDETVLQDGDQVAVIPPVSGG